MRFSFALFLLTSTLVLSGCGATPTGNGVPALVSEKTPVAPAAPEDSVTPADPLLLYRPGFGGRLFYGYERTDCVSLENQNHYGGDLLYTIANDEWYRNQLSLEAYTPAYAERLMTLLNATLPEGERIHAAYACHLAPDVDVVVGRAWPVGKPTRSQGELYIEPDPAYALVPLTLYVIQGDTVRAFPDVSAWSSTATGGETQACDASLVGKAIQWDCFTGLGFKKRPDGQEETYGTYRTWTIPLDGRAPTWKDRP